MPTVLPLNNASSYIQWQVIRKNSAFIKRQRGIPKQFSTEPFNMACLNSIRHNGLINRKAVDVQPAKNGKGVQITLKKRGKAVKPAQSTVVTTISKDSRKTLVSVGKLVGNYKPAHAKLAQRRASQILCSQKKSKKQRKQEQQQAAAAAEAPAKKSKGE